MSRDIRTLLFCKVSPDRESISGQKKVDHNDVYREICELNLNGEGSKQSFFALGGFDALCVYPTIARDCPFGLEDSTEWLGKIYEDKRRIISSINRHIVYHQMHLITNQDTSDFWALPYEEYPFFMASFAYGVQHNRDDSDQKQGVSHLREGESSVYEHAILEYLEDKIPTENQSTIRYVVYNGISVSDVVILWRTNDICAALDYVSGIELNGVARKTLTTLAFPMGSDGRILPCAYQRLVDMHSSGQKLTVAIRGSIRRMQEFQNIQKALFAPQNNEISKMLIRKLRPRTDSKRRVRLVRHHGYRTPERMQIPIHGINNPRNYNRPLTIHKSYQNFGENDFTISADVTFANIAHLLNLYYETHATISSACWEIHTDFRKEFCSDGATDDHARFPRDILTNVYQDFLDIFNNDKGPGISLKEYPWAYDMVELLGTHYYIDRHPILHGPSYLLYKTLKIANAYFSGEVMDFESTHKIKSLLHDSNANLYLFIQNWDQLTEQIIRNDDVMLNSRSNSHAIHFSLPESALDFYHAFLRRIVDFLVEYDKNEGRKPENFEYDFLLSPKPITRFRFAPMFRTDMKYRTEEYGNKIWPEKQAYILELPQAHIFNPMEIIYPMIHECFHCFGDTLRLRELRLQNMSMFIATALVYSSHLDHKDYQKFMRTLALQIYPKELEGTVSYFSKALPMLKQKTYYILGYEGLDSLHKELGSDAFYLYSNRVMTFWSNGKDNFRASRTHLETMAQPDWYFGACRHFFKECYADAMSIALLELTPQEYLDRFKSELIHFHDHEEAHLLNHPNMNTYQTRYTYDNGSMYINAQRLAIVFAACGGNPHVRYFKKEECLTAIEHLKNTDDGKYSAFSNILLDCYLPFVEDRPMPNHECAIPVAALMQVVDYLNSCFVVLFKKAPSLKIDIDSTTSTEYHLHDLREDYDSIIRKGKMFDRRFYQIIYEHHHAVRAKVDEERKICSTR